jgi:isocitrate dehydrogenase
LELKSKFSSLYEKLKANEETILNELNGVQGHPVDLGGYYKVDERKTSEVMRPSETFNSIISNF